MKQCSHCGSPVYAKGLCRSEYSRRKDLGEFPNPRCGTFGMASRHPLYTVWQNTNLGPGRATEWLDFWVFLEQVGDRPDNGRLVRLHKSLPIGPGNWKWHIQEDSLGGTKESVAAYNKRYRLKKADELKDKLFRRKYGIGLPEYAALLRIQGGCCAICRKKPGRKPLAVDHCHNSSVVRGLLCSHCNTGIGGLRDSPELLRAAIDYLAAPPAQIANAA